MCFWEEANFKGHACFKTWGVPGRWRSPSPPASSTTGYKTHCPDSVLLHGGCCCLWYFVHNVNLYVFVPPHTLLLLHFFCPHCLSVSLSLGVWNLHNVVRPSRLIIHVLLTPPVSSVLSEICLFWTSLAFMFPLAYPRKCCGANVLFVLSQPVGQRWF